MTKHFQNNETKAAAVALHNLLGKMLKEDGDVPPGNYDVSGTTLTFTLPNNTNVERAAGQNGDGYVHKTPTQNLYGWNVITEMAKQLHKFNQWNAIKAKITEAVANAMNNQKTTAEELQQIDPELAKALQDIQNQVKANMPKRKEKTPRKTLQTKETYPSVQVQSQHRKAA